MKNKDIMRKKCLLISYFISSNIGDKVISYSLHQMLNEKFFVRTVDYSTLSRSRKELSDVSVDRGIYKIVNQLKRFPALLRFLKGVRFYYLGLRDATFLKEIDRCDFVVIGGGNMLYDLTKETASGQYFESVINPILHNGKQVHVTSIGFGPFASEGQLKKAVKALEKCNSISFRDAASLQLFNTKSTKNVPTCIVTDPAFLFPYGKSGDIASRRVVGINVINLKLAGFDNSFSDKYEKAISELIMNLVNNMKLSITLFATESRDYLAIERILDLLPEGIVIDTHIINDYDEIIDLYSKFILVIGSRMHSLIFSITQGIPVVGIAYQKKVYSMFEMLSMSDYVVDIQDFCKSTESVHKMSQRKIERINEETISTKEAVETIRGSSKLNIEKQLKCRVNI